ncbi:TPA: CusA/CzcA family heavy metal efflux RND transporter [Enterobacter asburiae]|nr:CusA/CzcA family heavy metal efflux RND transporter [Enterobacter asburiae]
MIEWIIRRSVANRFLVMMGALFLSVWGTWTIINTPVDALPDLSDVQVIIKTSYPGQAPQIVENQVTYPLTTTMLSVPGAKTVRGFSQFGDSYVYVIFEDGTDLYWARSRVLEYLNQVQGKLPAGVSSEIGPDATGVGWIFEYALVDRSGKHDLAELRSLQDWFLKFELKTIPNVAEVASVGGVVKQYQIQVNPLKLAQYGISLPEVKQALESSNQEAGGSSVEMAEAEYMVRASGYLQTMDDFNNIVLKAGENGVPIYLRDVARVQTGPEMRRGIAELNGQGEVAGGVVILRSGKNAREVITAVKDKLETLKASLPEGVEIVTTYDRSQLIDLLPKINEGDLLYMPSTLPGVSPAEAAALLQTTDKLIKTVPEVASVFGKTGKAETATDSAPLEMVETTIQLKPENEWRPGMTNDKIIDELDKTVRLPGLANLWVPPIRNRIDMLSTGIKSPIGIKVSGTVLSDIDATAQSIEAVAKTVPGVVSALAERLEGGRYIDVDIKREKASRYGMTVGDVQLFVSSAIGGATVGETVEGVARYPINIRYPHDYRNSPNALKQMPILTPMKQQITLGDVADINVVSGPTMLKTENARPASWIYIDARGRDMVSVVNDIKTAISQNVKLRPGTSVSFSGQFELLEHANKKLKLMVPMTVMIIFILLYLAFRRVDEALLILMSLPFALVGGIWFLYWQGFHMSVATGTGFIALAGVAAEFGVVMLMYLRHAVEAQPALSHRDTFTEQGLDNALYHGAVLRVRPKAMTVAVIIAGLLPILWGTGAGSEVMSRIAAPMIGGMITAPLLSLFIIPAAYKLIWLRRHKKP